MNQRLTLAAVTVMLLINYIYVYIKLIMLGQVDVNEGNLRTEMKKKQNPGGSIMSEEEIKIRGELEKDIERDLEEEIKDGIYHLALRLHRFYQHQKERKAGETLIDKRSKALSEVNISIKMEGGTKIEIKEIKKEAQQGRPMSSTISENVKDVMPVSHKKKFDWAKSLRSGMNSEANVNQKSGSASGQRKGTAGVVDTKVAAELGWKW